MDQALADMFGDARKLVMEGDRKLAEKEERRHEKDRDISLMELACRVESAFDFTGREKLELDPRLDLQDGKPILEFAMRSLEAVFVLAPQSDSQWALTILGPGRQAQDLGQYKGGTQADAGSRRVAAARIVAAIGHCVQKMQSAPKKPAQKTAASLVASENAIGQRDAGHQPGAAMF